MAWGFVLAAFLLFHTYVGYLGCLVLWDAARGLILEWQRVKRTPRAHTTPWVEPKISLVTAAYNEEDCIREKILNSFNTDYPPDKIQLIIGSDGSTDQTERIVQQTGDPRLLLSTAGRAGKSGVLNRCLPLAEGEIVVLTDANTRLKPDSLRNLISHFSNPRVAAVCGRLTLAHPTQHDFKESAYWQYETLLKVYEGRLGVVVGANGGFYAIRKSLFEPLPPETIVDDLVIPMRLLTSGYEVVFAPEAEAYEETADTLKQEFERRVRISAGNFQSLKFFPEWLSPLGGRQAFAFWSHKVLRWLAPLWMGVLLVTNALLAQRGSMWKILLGAQAAFYALAFLGKYVSSLSTAYYFVSMNWALARGLGRFLRKSQPSAWSRTPRPTLLTNVRPLEVEKATSSRKKQTTEMSTPGLK